MSYVKKVTVIFIFAVVVIASLFDVYVYVRGGTDATISWTIFEAAHKFPMIPFFVGVLCGHFFWQMKPHLKLGSKEK